MDGEWRNTAGTIGRIALAMFLIFWGFTMLVALARSVDGDIGRGIVVGR